MLNVTMLIVVMLNVVMLSAILQSIIMLSFVTKSVVTSNVVRLNVIAPFFLVSLHLKAKYGAMTLTQMSFYFKEGVKLAPVHQGYKFNGATTLSMMTISIKTVVYAVSHFYCFAECHYTECRYADCRGASLTALLLYS